MCFYSEEAALGMRRSRSLSKVSLPRETLQVYSQETELPSLKKSAYISRTTMSRYLSHSDTIVALATPHGVGAIAVIRISGDEAFDMVERIFYTKKQEPYPLRDKD